jgi:hypothetical protein
MNVDQNQATDAPRYGTAIPAHHGGSLAFPEEIEAP